MCHARVLSECCGPVERVPDVSLFVSMSVTARGHDVALPCGTMSVDRGERMKHHYANIYATEAERYDALVAREDHQGNLMDLLSGFVHPSMHVVELGAGTGRLTRWLAPRVARLHAFDASEAMLRVASRHLREHRHVHLVRADHRDLPLADGAADLVIEGWALGHLLDDGPTAVSDALAEARRVARPGAPIVLIETLGTGCEAPTPPTERLAHLYDRLETQGFEKRWCRTDYRFESVAEGVELLGFFFGADMARRFEEGRDLTFPECTGVWVDGRGSRGAGRPV